MHSGPPRNYWDDGCLRLYRAAMPTFSPSAHPQCTLILFSDFGARSLIYLLTYLKVKR